MRTFIDLHLKPEPHYKRAMLEKAKELGFSEIALTDISRKKNDEFVTRIDLLPRNKQDLFSSLKKSRRNYEIVSVICNSKKVAGQAAKDYRVDVLLYQQEFWKNSGVWFDRNQASLARESGCCYEINTNIILKIDQKFLPQYLRNIKKEVLLAQRYEVPIIVSSGATSVSEMKGPRSLVALMSLLDIPEKDALEMVSSIPLKIIKTNRSKLNDNFLNPWTRRI
jgi:ribonuclease P/MRP protein subunit RPP1